MFDTTEILRNQKQLLTTTYVRDIDGHFVVKLGGMKIDGHFLNTELPLNEDDNNFE